MAKLNDIKGYWDMSYGYNFNDNDMWEGKILLEDDGWFEGIVIDPNSSYTEDRFIFGVYHSDRVIELFKFTPINVSSPFVFHGKRNVDGYDGKFETIGLLGTEPCGVSHIITQDAEAARGNVDSEVLDLEMRIQRYKDSVMDDIGREFYNNSIAMRNSMCKIILRSYQGRGFTIKEKREIMNECRPVNQRVVEATREATKRLVREKTNVVFEEDDLPF